MCESEVGFVSGSRSQKRLRIWETEPARHCSIVGTCLTLNEIRALARKLNWSQGNETVSDYQLHGFFVREANRNSLAGKLLNKTLDRKHGAAIKRFQKCQSIGELSEVWNGAFCSGDIPGPYWAILSHPLLDEKLGLHVYGEVHMLSHIAGASSRADRTALRRVKLQAETLESRLKKEALCHNQVLGEKDRNIAKLRRDLAAVNGRLAEYRATVKKSVIAEVPEEAVKAAAERKIELLEARLADAEETNESLRQAKSVLLASVEALEAEIRTLGRAVVPATNKVSENNCPVDLDGCNILYVGGRSNQIGRYKELVERCNGELRHHDGGLEKSMDELARAVGRADAVVFPTDCISHNAALAVKRLCRQSLKPYVPLRTSGVASLVAGLREGVAKPSH